MSKNLVSKGIAPTQNDVESVCGIDALVFYCKIDKLDYTDFFYNSLLRDALISDNFEMLSRDYNNQFTYFDYSNIIKKDDTEGVSPIQKIARIGFKNLNDKDNLHFIKVQMYTIALQQFTLKQLQKHFNDLFNSFGLIVEKFQISETHLNTYVFDFGFEWLEYDFFSSKMRNTDEKKKIGVLETFYLGSRGNGLYLRIYDKLVQLSTLEYVEANQKQHLIDLKYLSKYSKLPDYSKVWNVEIEIKRQQLRYYKIDTLEDLDNKINSVFKYIFTEVIRLMQFKKGTIMNITQIPTHAVWSQIVNSYDFNGFPLLEIDKEKMKEYKRDRIWLKNRLTEFLGESKNTDFYLREKVQELLTYLERYADTKGVKNGIC